MTKINVETLRAWLIRAIWCLGCITLVGMILGGVLFFSITQASGRNAHDQEGQVEVYSKEQIDKFITSVLIVIQNQPLSQEKAQADMVFIVSFNAFEQRLTVGALANQTLMEVEGYGQKSLGEAYALGGPGLLVNTINQNFNLDMQKYVSTDTYTLATIIDLLGGVQTELTPSEKDYIYDALGENSKGLQAGTTTLNGVQSMVHAMDNLSGQEPLGSLDRSLALINSVIINMRKTATKKAMLPLLSLVFSSIQSNFDLATLQDLGYEILKAEEIEYSSLIIPTENSWKYTGLNGEELKADIALNGAVLREALYNVR